MATGTAGACRAGASSGKVPACLPACPCGTRRPLVDGGHVCVIERLVSLPDPRLVRVGWLWLTRGAGGHAPTGTGWPGTLALAWLGWPWAGRANRSARAPSCAFRPPWAPPRGMAGGSVSAFAAALRRVVMDAARHTGVLSWRAWLRTAIVVTVPYVIHAQRYVERDIIIVARSTCWGRPREIRSERPDDWYSQYCHGDIFALCSSFMPPRCVTVYSLGP